MMGVEDTRAHCTDDIHTHNWPETAPCQELGAQEVNGVRHQTPQVPRSSKAEMHKHTKTEVTARTLSLSLLKLNQRDKGDSESDFNCAAPRLYYGRISVPIGVY